MSEATRLPVMVSLTRLSDGSTVEFADELYQQEDYDGTFIWHEGNYSCDCNRSLFFQRALGMDEDDIESESCGEKAYRVNWIKDSTGKIWYEEKPKQ